VAYMLALRFARLPLPPHDGDNNDAVLSVVHSPVAVKGGWDSGGRRW
jgi:hypothetical protein